MTDTSTKRDVRWHAHYTALDAYVTREGHALVPARHTELELPLGTWVTTQRRNHRRGTLSTERTRLLELIPGWTWGPLPSGPTRNESRLTDIRALHTAGHSISEIAGRYGLSRQRIHQLLTQR